METFEKKINYQMTELDKSHGNLKSEMKNFFNLDEMNFSDINGMRNNREESEMFDIQALNKEFSTEISGKIRPLPLKKKPEYDFM